MFKFCWKFSCKALNYTDCSIKVYHYNFIQEYYGLTVLLEYIDHFRLFLINIGRGCLLLILVLLL